MPPRPDSGPHQGEYQALLRRRPLWSEAELTAAIAIVNSLLDTTRSPAEESHLDKLSELVAAYETVHHPID